MKTNEKMSGLNDRLDAINKQLEVIADKGEKLSKEDLRLFEKLKDEGIKIIGDIEYEIESEAKGIIDIISSINEQIENTENRDEDKPSFIVDYSENRMKVSVSGYSTIEMLGILEQVKQAILNKHAEDENN
jgi:hemerythrin-like domain-containing protein